MFEEDFGDQLLTIFKNSALNLKVQNLETTEHCNENLEKALHEFDLNNKYSFKVLMSKIIKYLPP